MWEFKLQQNFAKIICTSERTGSAYPGNAGEQYQNSDSSTVNCTIEKIS